MEQRKEYAMYWAAGSKRDNIALKLPAEGFWRDLE